MDESKPNLFKKIINLEPSYKATKISEEALDLLKCLLNKDPDLRIKPDYIPHHAWFRTIDFEEIGKLKVVPPFIPKIVKRLAKYRKMRKTCLTLIHIFLMRKSILQLNQ